jgi:hypothetical protein
MNEKEEKEIIKALKDLEAIKRRLLKLIGKK